MSTNSLTLTIREVLYETRFINEGVWDSKEGDLRYWIALFNSLKTLGMKPKYGSNKKEVSDPKIATSIYSGPWSIRKDTSKSNGYVININRKGVYYSAKITSNGGKYAGEDLSKTMLKVYNPKTKTSADMSLKDFLSLNDTQFFSKLSKASADKKFDEQTEKDATNVINKLKAAFDLDKDGKYDDYDGTYEDKAISAIYSIKNKNQLDAINKKIKSLGIAQNLKQWVNWEMSDFDPQEYRKLWKHLESLGYKGADYNLALAATGVAYDLYGGKVLEDAGQALQNLKNLSIKDIMEGFREMLNGVTGGVVQSLLAIFGGPIGNGINLFAWASLLVWDIYQWVTNKPNWWNLIVDTLSVVTAGIAAKFLSPAKAVASKAKTLSGLMTVLGEKFPTVAKYIKSFGGKLVSLGKSAIGGVKNALGWLSSKLPFLSGWWTKLKGVVGKIGEFIGTLEESLSKLFLGGATNTVSTMISNNLKLGFPKVATFLETSAGKELAKALTKAETKLIDKYVTGPLKGKTMEYAQNYVCKNGTKSTCQVFKRANTYYKIGTDITKAGKSGKEAVGSVVAKDLKASVDKIKSHVKDVKTAAQDIEKV